jgi:hypothetical protein
MTQLKDAGVELDAQVSAPFSCLGDHISPLLRLTVSKNKLTKQQMQEMFTKMK